MQCWEVASAGGNELPFWEYMGRIEMSKKKKEKAEVVGVSEDGRQAVGGIFKIMDTHGLPLEEIMHEFDKKGLMVAFDYFIRDALKAGWSSEKALAVVEKAVTIQEMKKGADGSRGKDTAREVVRKLRNNLQACVELE